MNASSYSTRLITKAPHVAALGRLRSALPRAVARRRLRRVAEPCVVRTRLESPDHQYEGLFTAHELNGTDT